jgi:hypothetical protein
MNNFTDDELAILQGDQKVYRSADAGSRSMIINMVVKKLLLQRDDGDEINDEEKEALTGVSVYFIQLSIHNNHGLLSWIVESYEMVRKQRSERKNGVKGEGREKVESAENHPNYLPEGDQRDLC